ncbi:hypothetical protein [Pseudomonas sp. GV071]|uniref:hypothetical protein n=1 Tax=Pseudomonas sp. GV071 TaxID=2135754 RepID=UPI000D3B6206|nr:hypothetical protein [Pseudomonas sp. GV071]PTQ70307.1 hypothetical protein C8K61_10629 [Pseudomonas sp. GV071]
MPGIKDVAVEFEAFIASLSTEREELIEYIAALNNGFEGWLKLEFYFWLIKNRKLRAATSDADVGLEYKVALDQRHAGIDRETKQCDLWVRNNESGFHFIELKAPFFNSNKGKVLLSAAHDLWYMSRLTGTYEQVATGSTIAVGIGFTAEDWAEQMDKVRDYCETSKPIAVKLGSLGNHPTAHWAALTVQY